MFHFQYFTYLGEGPNCEGNFTMSFFIPMAFQENTPLPLDSDVYIEERPAMNVAAIQFPGFPGDVDFGIKVSFLGEDVISAIL